MDSFLFIHHFDKGRLPDNAAEDGHSEVNAPTGPGEVRDAPGNGGADLKKAHAQWRVKVAQAMDNLPGGIKRLIDEVLHPKVDWRTVLRHVVEQAARNDYAWIDPSRRYLAHGLCLPGLHSRQLGERGRG